MVIVLQLIS